MTRIGTGLPGLDVILGGGFEPGSVVVMAGQPGTGKTILAQQICFRIATTARPVIYYTTLSEPHSKLVEHLRHFAFFDASSLGGRVEYIHLGDVLRDSRDGGLGPFVDEIVRKSLEVEPALVVVDSVKMLRDFVHEYELRASLYDLTSRIAHTGTVLLLLGEYTDDEIGAGAEFVLADGIIHLAYEPREPLDRRWLRVIKMRGGPHREGKHTCDITADGFEVFPRLDSAPASPAFTDADRLSSGVPGLDRLLGGGIPRGDATVVTGPSGVGKSSLALHYIHEGLSRAERCLYLTFQDTADTLANRADGFGLGFSTATASGQLTILPVEMGALDLDVFAAMVHRHLADGTTSRIVIDSLAEMAFSAHEAERFPAFLSALTGLIRAHGTTLLITGDTTMNRPLGMPLDEILVLFANVLQVDYGEPGSTVGRRVHVAKMRNSQHDSGRYECAISDHGWSVGARVHSEPDP
jgi:circadian clock protein KaiC